MLNLILLPALDKTDMYSFTVVYNIYATLSKTWLENNISNIIKQLL